MKRQMDLIRDLLLAMEKLKSDVHDPTKLGLETDARDE